MGLIQGFKGMILPTGVSLSANTASVGSGVEYQLEAYITPELATNNKIHWSASNNNVTVDESGLVTGVTDGTSVVTATTDYGGYTASCTFTVFTVHVTGVSLNESELSLNAGDTFQLEATITPSNATNKNVTWRSTDTSIAVVDNNGLVTCIEDGECQIIVTTADGSYIASCDIVPGFPKEYQQVEYIQSSGSQYIDTGITFDTNEKLNSMEMYMKATHSGTGNFMGLYNGSYVTMEVPGNASTTLRCFIGNSSTYTDRAILHSDNTTIDEITYNYTSSLATFIVNGTEYTQSRSGTYNTGGTTLTIFARKNGSSMEQYLSMKMYSSYVKIGGEFVRYFIPCYRKSDGVIGLWDKIGKQFYTNQGSGNFTKGQDIINIKDVQEVEYIQSSGNGTNNGQFIKPDVPVSSGVELKIQTKFTNLNSTTDEREVFATYGGGVNLQCNVTSSAISINNWSSYTITPNTTSNGTTHILEATYTGGSSSSRNPFLFAQNEGDSYGRWCCSIKLYYFKIYQNNVLVRDFMPCYRKSDNVIGLFDKVNNIFYTNQGSGTFTKGPDV